MINDTDKHAPENKSAKGFARKAAAKKATSKSTKTNKTAASAPTRTAAKKKPGSGKRQQKSLFVSIQNGYLSVPNIEIDTPTSIIVSFDSSLSGAKFLPLTGVQTGFAWEKIPPNGSFDVKVNAAHTQLTIVDHHLDHESWHYRLAVILPTPPARKKIQPTSGSRPRNHESSLSSGGPIIINKKQ
ncbi:MAG: hypothetical protein JSR34_05425 [Proteobacteria bacterium]|nr:hypothetical protein [Pseudomonadota bacterium]